MLFNLWNLWMLPCMAKSLQMWLRILRWEDYLRLSCSILNAITCILIRGRQSEILLCTEQKTCEDKAEREIWEFWPWNLEGCSHIPRNSQSHQNLEGARNIYSLNPLEGGWPCWHIDPDPMILIWTFWTSKLWENKFCGSKWEDNCFVLLWW